ncbi:MAG: alpha/beta hydrolase [Candidatus Cryptobacteroides sp.]
MSSGNTNRTNRTGKAKKAIKYCLASLVALYIVIVAVAPVITVNLLSNKHVNYARVFRAEEAGLPDPDTLRLYAEDGTMIHALELRPEEEVKGAIVCLTGIENPSVTYFYGHARLFRELGLVTLLPEVRGHGESGGDRICLAYNEAADVKAVTEYVKSTYGDIPAIVMGLSMGGAVAIRSIGNNEDIDALVSISAFSSVEDEISGFFSRVISRPLAWPLRLPTSLCCSLKFGVNAFKERPLKDISRLDGRPALMMHSRGDTEVPYSCFEKLYAKAILATERLETYVVDGDEHFVSSSFGVPENDPPYYNCLKAFLESVIDR